MTNRSPRAKRELDPDVAMDLHDLETDTRVVLQHLGPGADIVMERELFYDMVAKAKARREAPPTPSKPHRQRKPRPPRPEPPPLTPEEEAEIAEAARITPEDIARAREWWRRHAPERARDYFDAVPEDGTGGVPDEDVAG